jgi:hypothetical protein
MWGLWKGGGLDGDDGGGVLGEVVTRGFFLVFYGGRFWGFSFS